MLRIFCSLLLLSFITACQSSQSLELWSQPVYEGFGVYAEQEIKPITIPLTGSHSRRLSQATNLATKVVSYGSGGDIWVNLVVDKSVESASREDLIRTAMSAAMVFYQFVYHDGSDEDQSVQANIYMVYTNSHEYNVLLATASIAAPPEKYTDLSFPGEAWFNVIAAERLPTKTEIRYVQEMQLNRYDWGIKVDQEDMRLMLTPEQDAQISHKLNIAPGSINLEFLVLKPID